MNSPTLRFAARLLLSGLGIISLSAQTTITLVDGQDDGTAYTFSEPTALTIASGTGTLSGNLSGTSAVAKTGAGTLLLTGTTNFSGPLTIEAGILLSGHFSMAASSVTANSGATFGTRGSSTQLAGGLTLNAGAALSFSATSSSVDYLRVSGPLTGPGAGSVTVNLDAPPDFEGGTHRLILARGGVANDGLNPARYQLGAAPAGFTYELFAAGPSLALYADPVVAGEVLWQGLGADARIATAGNWLGGIAPATDGTAFLKFRGTTALAPNFDTAASIQGIVFRPTSGSFTLSGATVTLGTGGIRNDSSATQTLDHNIVLGGNQTWTVAGASLVVGGNISGTAALRLAGESYTAKHIVLAGTNSFSGPVTVTGNFTLDFTSAASFGTATVNFESFDGTLRWPNGNGVDLSARLGGSLAQSSLSLNSNGNDIVLTTSFSGSGTIYKGGAGNLTLGAASTHASTYVGEGNLILNHPLALQQSLLEFSSSSQTLVFGNVTTATVGNLQGELTVALENALAQPVTLTVGGVALSSTAAVAFSGSGSLAIVGTESFSLNRESTHTGTTVVADTVPEFYLGHALALQNSTLTVPLHAGALFSGGAGGAFTFGGLAGNHPLALVDTDSNPVALAVGQNNGNSTYGGILSGPGGSLRKIGAGTLTLGGASTYTGGTRFSAGTITLGITQALPDAGTVVFDGGTLALAGFNQTLGALDLDASSVIDFGSGAGASALAFANSSALAWSGTLTILNFNAGSDTLRFGTSAAGLTSGQLSAIAFQGFGSVALIDSSGFVSAGAIPEPSTYAALAGLGALAFAFIRRRRPPA
ncbi:MAG: hypothetical protein B9S34_16025 [Opitutia bacterium Tous-C1TDCM]|nr:MAG: hypothetical protein B9S34_16025 [Opitutae bacterium Tous-C1TDCM]